MTPENVKRVQAYFEEHKAEIKADIIKLTACESPTTNKEYTDKCGILLAEMIKERTGVAPEIFPQESVGPMIKAVIGDAEKKLLMIGHYDTVHNVGTVPLVDEGDIIKGPGIFDMKTGLVSFMWVIKCIKDLDLPCDKSFVLFSNSDEEIGSAASRPLYLQGLEAYRAALVGEPAQGAYIKTLRKGATELIIKLTGRAAHAGVAITDGRSAITEACHLTLYLHSLLDLEVGTTVNVGAFHGGERFNVVCPEVQLSVDCRFLSKEREKELLEKVMAYVPHDPDVKVDITTIPLFPPLERTPENKKLFQQLKAAGAQIGLELEEIMSGGGSDGSMLSSAGCPTIDSLGAVGGGIHASNEYIDFPKSLERMILQTIFVCDLD